MSNVVLKAENISKQYRLGLVGTGTISHDLNRWWHKVRGKEDPYLKIGEANNRSVKGNSDYVWALKDINFEVNRGEVLGIIGKNGAGKSTLLKILSRVTLPTTGNIKTKGRIASLLEVGTGFHSEMTGRENIFLNGAILGMTKKEISSKIDEIIDFSGCERYIDTPVKRYSSGMTVRLAFAVAAFLEPDILVVDEVLAVGDAEFQKRAIGKMKDISTGEGRTVLFVSHNMAAVKRLCTRGIVLEHGKSVFKGSIENTVNYYLENNSWKGVNTAIVKKGKQGLTVKQVKFKSNKTQEQETIITGQPLKIEFAIENKKHIKVDDMRLDFKIDDVYGKRIVWLSSALDNDFIVKGDSDLYEIVFDFKKFPLVQGKYVLSYVLMTGSDIQENAQDYMRFEVLSGNFYNSSINITEKHTSVLLDCNIYSNPYQ